MSRRATIAHAAVFLATISFSAAQTTALDDGLKLFREGRFDQALVKLEQAHRIAPRNATIENLLGITETQLGHLDEAAKHYRNAIHLDPTQAAPHRNLGFNLLTAKEFAEAEPELREAARLDPANNFAHYYLLLAALATGRDADAVKEASLAGQLIDGDPEAAAGLIEAEIRVGRADDAISLAERFEQANQLSPAREYEIAILFSQHAFYRQSALCFRHIASLDPTWENRYNLSLAYLYNNQAAEASALLATLHAERPANADALMFLGEAFEIQRKMPEALQAYRDAVAADPENPDRMLDYTRLLMDLDRYDEAILAVRSGMEKTSAAEPLQLRLGAVEMVKGDYAAARDAFQSALATNPALDTAYVGLAQISAREANDVAAIRILEAARAKYPGHYLLEYYFGLLASRTGREPEAIVALENASRLEPRSIDPFYELGRLYAVQQDWPRALKALEHAVELNPQFQPAHYQLSRVYSHLGMSAKAKEEADRTRALVDAQRDEALRNQRERGASFQPQVHAAPGP